jgi:hypothetical protein
MSLVAVICGVAGLLLGMIANVRPLALAAALAALAAFLSAIGTGESLLAGVLWSAVGLVVLQVGYMIAVVARAAGIAGQAKPSAPSP